MAHLWFATCSCGWQANAESRGEANILIDEHKIGLADGWHFASLRGELFPLVDRGETKSPGSGP